MHAEIEWLGLHASDAGLETLVLEKLFWFGGRMGRLSFFGWSCAGAAISFVVALVLIILEMLMSGSSHRISANPHDQGYLVTGGTIIVGFWISLALQTKRLRDMGRDPFVWIVGVWTVLLFDQYVLTLYTAARNSSFSFGVYTPFGGLVSAAYSIFLLFTPSAESATTHDVTVQASASPSPVDRLKFN
jgi:uncharacterized membrane protein YhaH (DUF805 family)